MSIILSKKAGGSGGGGAPSGPAGGSLAGTYPNPTIAPDAVGTTEIDDGSVTAAKLATGIIPNTLLFSSQLGGDAASIDSGAGGFATTHQILRIFVLARTTEAAVSSTVLIRFNNDSGANYDRSTVRNLNSTLNGSNSLAQTSFVIDCFGASAQTGAWAALDGTIPGYAQTVTHKSWSLQNTRVEDTAADAYSGINGLRWRSTAAISRVSVTAGSGNLLAGSAMWIYAF